MMLNDKKVDLQGTGLRPEDVVGKGRKLIENPTLDDNDKALKVWDFYSSRDTAAP